MVVWELETGRINVGFTIRFGLSLITVSRKDTWLCLKNINLQEIKSSHWFYHTRSLSSASVRTGGPWITGMIRTREGFPGKRQEFTSPSSRRLRHASELMGEEHSQPWCSSAVLEGSVLTEQCRMSPLGKRVDIQLFPPLKAWPVLLSASAISLWGSHGQCQWCSLETQIDLVFTKPLMSM